MSRFFSLVRKSSGVCMLLTPNVFVFVLVPKVSLCFCNGLMHLDDDDDDDDGA